ncbi:MAG: helix-turn-helix domain-containing protein [Alphaproteobacteria bacterium]|jgi:DNA-binding Xre family transcriptional regulator|nr:MAG: helix-turn-helix domain-containing protein [Alphaproteobacteria bacterium]
MTTTRLSDLMAEFSDEDVKDVRKRARAHVKAMASASKLDELRRALRKNQGEVAAVMGIGQNAVSQLEKRSDIQLSTLSRYVESLGFHLELAVVARNGERIALKNFKPWQEIAVKASTASNVRPVTRRARGASRPEGTALESPSVDEKKSVATRTSATR